MAREMALAGVDRSELTPPLPPEKPHTLIGKLQNFWYHYKIPTLIAAAVAALAVLLGYQMFSKNPADYDMIVVTELPLYSTEIEALKEYVAACGEDLDGDGEVEVSIENLLPKYAQNGATSIGLADRQKLQTYLVSGEKMIFAFDRVGYDGFVASIADVTEEGYTFFGEINTTAEGYNTEEHYWCWSGDSRRQADVFKELPEEMLFGVRGVGGTASTDEAKAEFEQGAALIKNLAESAKP